MLEACALMQGYLVKTQESELKAMAVFSTPAAAVEWCMLVQEAALHLPYPADVLQQQRFRAVCDAGGNLVFRGPRIKMGMAEGSPTCIIPGEAGRHRQVSIRVCHLVLWRATGTGDLYSLAS
jgi:hypothetical protein